MKREVVMKLRCVISAGLVLVVAAAQFVWAGPKSDALKLTITTADATMRESNLTLRVTMQNGSNRRMTLIKSNPRCDFFAEVRDAKGQAVPLTRAGAELASCKQKLRTGRWIEVTLGPGESTEESYPIDLYYELARPGNYTVRLLHGVPSDPDHLIRSNEMVLKLAE